MKYKVTQTIRSVYVVEADKLSEIRENLKAASKYMFIEEPKEILKIE